MKNVCFNTADNDECGINNNGGGCLTDEHCVNTAGSFACVTVSGGKIQYNVMYDIGSRL